MTDSIEEERNVLGFRGGGVQEHVMLLNFSLFAFVVAISSVIARAEYFFSSQTMLCYGCPEYILKAATEAAIDVLQNAYGWELLYESKALFGPLFDGERDANGIFVLRRR